MRLQTKYSILRSELGKLVQAERKKRRIKQEALAGDLGIQRAALSRIENGRHLPRARLLEALVQKLEIEWNPVVKRLDALRPLRAFEEGARERALERLGNDIHQRRKAERLTLRVLGRRLRMSAAQLSRIERRQVLHSRIFRDHLDDLVYPREHRRIQIIDCRVNAFIRD